MKKVTKPRHTAHSSLRLAKRTKLTEAELRRRLRDKESIGLPQQSLNKRVAVIADGDGKPLVVIWVKRTMEIITVYNLDWYLSRHPVRAPLVAAIRERFK